MLNTQLEELTNGLDRQCLVGRFGVYISRTLKAIALHQQNLAERVKACCDTYIDLFFDYDFQEVTVCPNNESKTHRKRANPFQFPTKGTHLWHKVQGKMEGTHHEHHANDNHPTHPLFFSFIPNIQTDRNSKRGERKEEWRRWRWSGSMRRRWS